MRTPIWPLQRPASCTEFSVERTGWDVLITWTTSTLNCNSISGLNSQSLSQLVSVMRSTIAGSPHSSQERKSVWIGHLNEKMKPPMRLSSTTGFTVQAIGQAQAVEASQLINRWSLKLTLTRLLMSTSGSSSPSCIKSVISSILCQAWFSWIEKLNMLIMRVRVEQGISQRQLSSL